MAMVRHHYGRHVRICMCTAGALRENLAAALHSPWFQRASVVSYKDAEERKRQEMVMIVLLLLVFLGSSTHPVRQNGGSDGAEPSIGRAGAGGGSKACSRAVKPGKQGKQNRDKPTLFSSRRGLDQIRCCCSKYCSSVPCVCVMVLQSIHVPP